MDMAGFAVNLNLIMNNENALFPLRVRRGELETEFLSLIITRDQLEPKANNCTKVGLFIYIFLLHFNGVQRITKSVNCFIRKKCNEDNS